MFISHPDRIWPLENLAIAPWRGYDKGI